MKGTLGMCHVACNSFTCTPVVAQQTEDDDDDDDSTQDSYKMKPLRTAWPSEETKRNSFVKSNDAWKKLFSAICLLSSNKLVYWSDYG